MKWRARLLQLLIALLFFGTWEFFTRAGFVNRLVLPSATASFGSALELLRDPTFMTQCAITLARVVVAFIAAAPSAIFVGLLLAELTHFGRVFNPVMYFALAVPQSIFLPIFMQIFGLGDVEKVVFGATHIFFIVAVNTVGAVESVPRPYVLAARSFGASPIQIFFRIYLPAMLPLLLTGLRIGMVLNIASVLFAEMYASRTGVGMKIMQWSDALHTETAIGAILIISIFTIVFNEVVRGFESRLGRWQISSMSH